MEDRHEENLYPGPKWGDSLCLNPPKLLLTDAVIPP